MQEVSPTGTSRLLTNLFGIPHRELKLWEFLTELTPSGSLTPPSQTGLTIRQGLMISSRPTQNVKGTQMERGLSTKFSNLNLCISTGSPTMLKRIVGICPFVRLVSTDETVERVTNLRRTRRRAQRFLSLFQLALSLSHTSPPRRQIPMLSLKLICSRLRAIPGRAVRGLRTLLSRLTC